MLRSPQWHWAAFPPHTEHSSSSSVLSREHGDLGLIAISPGTFWCLSSPSWEAQMLGFHMVP